MDNSTQIWKDVRSGVLDINNQDLFFELVAKALLYDLNKKLSLRGKGIPHYILNTGDDIMYLEVKGQDHSIERPAQNGVMPEVSNENYIYSIVPRCMVKPNGLNVPTDQLTSPYSYGNFEMENDDMIYTFHAEFRRMPVTIEYSLKYYLDSYTDAMSVIQQILTKLAFINNFQFSYLGNNIKATYKIPEAAETEYQMEFEGGTTDNRNRTIALDIQVDTNLPVVYAGTVIPGDKFISSLRLGDASNGGKLIIDGEEITHPGIYTDKNGNKYKVTQDDLNAVTHKVNMGIYMKGDMKREAQGETVIKDNSTNTVITKKP